MDGQPYKGGVSGDTLCCLAIVFTEPMAQNFAVESTPRELLAWGIYLEDDVPPELKATRLFRHRTLQRIRASIPSDADAKLLGVDYYYRLPKGAVPASASASGSRAHRRGPWQWAPSAQALEAILQQYPETRGRQHRQRSSAQDFFRAGSPDVPLPSHAHSHSQAAPPAPETVTPPAQHLVTVPEVDMTPASQAPPDNSAGPAGPPPAAVNASDPAPMAVDQRASQLPGPSSPTEGEAIGESGDGPRA
jgi:hypothetical protein